MAPSTFNSDYTLQSGTVFSILVESFAQEITELATILSITKPENDRVSFIEQLVQSARSAAPPAVHANGTDEAEDEGESSAPQTMSAPAPDTPEVKAAKIAVLESVGKDLETNGLKGASSSGSSCLSS